MKVLHCPSLVGGHAWGLSRAERRLGLVSDVMAFKNHPYGLPADIQLALESSSSLRSATRMLVFFLRALRRYDVFHFNFGASLLSHFRFPWIPDLLPLILVGKRIFMTFLGCDARLREGILKLDPDSACSPRHCGNAWCNARLDNIRRRRIKRFVRYASAVFCVNPDLMRFVPKATFLPYCHVDLESWRPDVFPKEPSGRPIEILHAPSDRRIKGTDDVVEAVARLQSKGMAVRLTIAENLSQGQLKRLIQACDLVVDQLLVGWYGGLAVEAMALGKPVIAYIREADLIFIPTRMREQLPVVSANPQNLADVLGRLLARPGALADLGLRSRRFVETWHNPMRAARMMHRYYLGDASVATGSVGI